MQVRYVVPGTGTLYQACDMTPEWSIDLQSVLDLNLDKVTPSSLTMWQLLQAGQVELVLSLVEKRWARTADPSHVRYLIFKVRCRG